MSFANTFANSFSSVWDMIIHHSLVNNVSRVLDLEKFKNSSELTPHLYGTRFIFCHSPEQLHPWEKNKHRVSKVIIHQNGQRSYEVEVGVISLSDKLVSSFLALPVTLFESLIYLLLAPTTLFTVGLVLLFRFFALPYFLFASKNDIEKLNQVFNTLTVGLLCGAGLALIMSVYRVFQAIFRVPVGLSLLVEAGIDKLLGNLDPPTTIQELNLEAKTPTEIKQLGISVIDSAQQSQSHNMSENSTSSVPPTSQPLSLPDKDPYQAVFDKLDIPDRYKCPIGRGLMKNPVLLSDGVFYDDENAMRLIPAGHLSPITKAKLTESYALLTFQEEITAFKQAIQFEHDQAGKEKRSPNYEPILEIAKKAQNEADTIFEEINKTKFSTDANQQKFLVRVAQEVKMQKKNFAEEFKFLSNNTVSEESNPAEFSSVFSLKEKDKTCAPFEKGGSLSEAQAGDLLNAKNAAPQ